MSVIFFVRSKNLRDYEVSIPIVGVYFTTVQASSPEEALRIAFEEADVRVDCLTGDVEYDLVKRITTGNVLHAYYNEAIAE